MKKERGAAKPRTAPRRPRKHQDDPDMDELLRPEPIIRTRDPLLAKLVSELEALEKCTAEIVLTLKKNGGFLPLTILKNELQKQGVQAEHLQLATAFLFGYLSAESRGSSFDTAVFGNTMSIMTDNKAVIVGAALHAVLYLRSDQDRLTKPEKESKSRRPSQK